MKKRWQHSKGGIVRGVLAAACAVLFFASQRSICFADATGKIKVSSVKVRQSADTNSEVIGSTSLGKTVTIISQTTDASGYVWYEVYVEADKTGYIRSDLLDVDSSSGTIPSSTTDTSAQSSEQSAASTSAASGAEIMPETGMDAQYATIKVRSANVRSAASTNKSVVCSLPANTQVVVTGQTEGTDKTWYYITFTGTDGAEKTGYVRSDMITLGEMVPVEEPQEAPETEAPQETSEQETPTVRQDYDIVYEVDSATGESVGYIYNYTDPGNVTKQNLQDVLTAAHAQSLNNELDAKTVAKQRIVIIVLIAVIIILAVVMTIMIFKLRDAYYETYEEEEDDEDEDEDERRRRERRKEAGSEAGKNARKSDVRNERSEKGERNERRRVHDDGEEPVRRKSASRDEKQPVARRKTTESERDWRMPEREVSYEEEAVVPVKTAPKKKAKNFMIDDDDFEFEFLNMKNKDKDI